MTYNGRSAKVLKITKPAGSHAVIATITHRGKSNFAVFTLDSGLQETDLLVNEIGNYQGTVLIDALDDQDTARLKIEADGRWTVTLKPVAAARQMTTKASGKGDDVLVYRGPSPAVATIANRGTDNFAVFGYSSEEGQDLMVNEIGKYSGEVTVTEGTFLIQVTAGDGKWTINVTG